MPRIDQIRELLSKSPDDAFLSHALALELIKQGNDNEARNIFESLLSREPGYIGSYYHLGKLQERAADYERAIETYRTGISHATVTGDTHAKNELQMALDEIIE